MAGSALEREGRDAFAAAKQAGSRRVDVGGRSVELAQPFPSPVGRPAAPLPVEEIADVRVTEVDGGIGHGPVRVLGARLAGGEVQILGR